MGTAGSSVSTYCCGGRVEKLKEEDGKNDGFPPVSGEDPDALEEFDTAPKPIVRAPKKAGLFKKMGEHCCCSNLGDKNQEQRQSLAQRPQLPAFDASELPGEPGMPKAVEAAMAGALRNNSEHQDLTGRWLLTRHDGDFDQIMAEAGKGWFLRSAAQAIGHGRGFAEMHIQQEPGGNGLICNKKLVASGCWVEQGGVVGCKPEERYDDLGPMIVESRYDESGALALSCMLTANGLRFEVRRVRFSPEELHEIFLFPSGLKAKQIFTLMDK